MNRPGTRLPLILRQESRPSNLSEPSRLLPWLNTRSLSKAESVELFRFCKQRSLRVWSRQFPSVSPHDLATLAWELLLHHPRVQEQVRQATFPLAYLDTCVRRAALRSLLTPAADMPVAHLWDEAQISPRACADPPLPEATLLSDFLWSWVQQWATDPVQAIAAHTWSLFILEHANPRDDAHSRSWRRFIAQIRPRIHGLDSREMQHLVLQILGTRRNPTRSVRNQLRQVFAGTSTFSSS